mmetsp:Transcript_52631/g.61440  ORF Transcript_52631/g.61440 Transcript_52631/m.61440 type:complete len:375 (-) Transcript_52631:412-1536(-)|eukprot:CAMPEP_0194376220 /NCGR_PEP_ID=MMETSP0174-20130528/24670_1 /TAXON_ID=216777 /ORGANISM="Proboscia alata, Strain PI-D3" /LENGTH=374 /DNA_ID=CAMNT_0039156797 /DNA_START=1 /DNA_END=1125 /DNA_ORIENTATION=-
MCSNLKATNSKSKSASMLGIRVGQLVVAFWVLVFAAAVARNNKVSKDPLIHMIPNFLLFTPFRAATKWCFRKVLVYDKEEKEMIPLPEISAKNYTFEKLREITDNFKHPAVVRGLFSETNAVKKWTTPGYLSQYLGDFEIPVIERAVYGTEQKDRIVMTFRDSFDEVLTDEKSMKYLFFPVKSRVAFNHSSMDSSNELLGDTVNELARVDLDLDRLWRGYGTEEHTTYKGAQIIAGQGGKAGKTGTNWHCAPGNNWFIQIAGRKRWYFMDQEYSAYMQPQRGGLNNVWTSAGLEMAELQKYLPVKYTDIGPGDMLYNPDFEWHTIKNYEGLSIGVPLREYNSTLTMRNNAQYAWYVIINHVFNKIGIQYGFGKA